MTTLFFFMIYNFQASSVCVCVFLKKGVGRGPVCAHKDIEIESLHRQDSSSYLPDKSCLAFDPLPTSLSAVFVFWQTTVMFS